LSQQAQLPGSTRFGRLSLPPWRSAAGHAPSSTLPGTICPAVQPLPPGGRVWTSGPGSGMIGLAGKEPERTLFGGEWAIRRHFWAVALATGGAILIACPQPAAAETAALTRLEEKKGSSPANLIGLTEEETTRLLGPATSTESRGPAQIWRYENSRCELDLVFFMEMRTGLRRSLHYDFKSGADNPAQQQACITAIVQENLRGVPSDKPPQMMAESSMENNISQLPKEIARSSKETPIEREIPAAAPSLRPQASRRESHVRRGHVHHHSRRFTAQRGGWGFTLAQRSYPGRASRDAALTTGWGGGQFGPAPYSATGQ
jgi:hypothetical protein